MPASSSRASPTASCRDRGQSEDRAETHRTGIPVGGGGGRRRDARGEDGAGTRARSRPNDPPRPLILVPLDAGRAGVSAIALGITARRATRRIRAARRRLRDREPGRSRRGLARRRGAPGQFARARGHVRSSLAPRLRGVSTVSVGFDHIDLAAACATLDHRVPHPGVERRGRGSHVGADPDERAGSTRPSPSWRAAAGTTRCSAPTCVRRRCCS